MNSQGSTAIQAFVFPRTKHKVRVVIDKHGNPWWVAKDVCEVLDLGQVSRAISRLDDDEKGVTTITTLGGNQQMAVVNESGLYSLIMTSRKPEAKAFKKWVTSEVLPTIRKTGSYGHKPQLEFDPNNLGHVQSVLAALSAQKIQDKATIEALEVKTAKITTRVIAAKAKLAAQTPVVDAYKRLAASEGSMNITEAAKNLKIPPTELTNYMLEAGWLYMRPPSTRKIAFQSKIKQGWMESEPFSKDLGDGRTYMSSQPKVTGTGLIRLARELNIVLTEPPQ
jgi:prophage antirepressor-like protein